MRYFEWETESGETRIEHKAQIEPDRLIVLWREYFTGATPHVLVSEGRRVLMIGGHPAGAWLRDAAAARRMIRAWMSVTSDGDDSDQLWADIDYAHSVLRDAIKELGARDVDQDMIDCMEMARAGLAHHMRR